MQGGRNHLAVPLLRKDLGMIPGFLLLAAILVWPSALGIESRISA